MAFGTAVDIDLVFAVLGFMIVVDYIGIKTKIGLFFLGSGMMGTFLVGNAFSTGSALTAFYYQGSAAAVPLTTADANVLLVLISIITILSLSLIFMLRWKTDEEKGFIG